VIDVVSEPLEGIVVASSVRINSAADNLLHTLHQFLVSRALVEPAFKGLPGVLVEALHAGTVGHHLHALHNLALVLADELEGEEEEQLEVEENVRVDAVHELQVVAGELEGCLFEGEVAWRAAEDEAEVDMDDVPVAVHQDVVVVTVLDLEQVLHHRISSQTLHEVGNTTLPLVSEQLLVDFLERSRPGTLLEVTHGFGVLHELYETAVLIERNHAVGSQPNLYVFLEADGPYHSNEFHSHMFLPEVIA
jgi:hypothetical protein